MVRVSLIFCMVFCGLAVVWGSPVDPRSKYWGENLIFHEAGGLRKESRVLCFGEGQLCSFIDRWYTDGQYIRINVTFEIVNINNVKKIKELTTHYRLEERSIIPIKITSMEPHSNACQGYFNKQTEIHCSYLVNINVFGDKYETKGADLPQYWNCFKRINGEKKSINCRQMMLNLLPFELHRLTGKTCERNDEICKKDYIKISK